MRGALGRGAQTQPPQTSASGKDRAAEAIMGLMGLCSPTDVKLFGHLRIIRIESQDQK